MQFIIWLNAKRISYVDQDDLGNVTGTSYKTICDCATKREWLHIPLNSSLHNENRMITQDDLIWSRHHLKCVVSLWTDCYSIQWSMASYYKLHAIGPGQNQRSSHLNLAINFTLQNICFSDEIHRKNERIVCYVMLLTFNLEYLLIAFRTWVNCVSRIHGSSARPLRITEIASDRIANDRHTLFLRLTHRSEIDYLFSSNNVVKGLLSGCGLWNDNCLLITVVVNNGATIEQLS